MANDKEIIKKLLSIATKQQKIITKLAQEKAPNSNPDQPVPTGNELPPQHLQPNPVKKENPSVAVREKMGPAASQINSIGFSTQGVQGGAKFKVQYSYNRPPQNQADLEKKIGDAVEAVQREGLPGMPMGSFYVEKV